MSDTESLNTEGRNRIPVKFRGETYQLLNVGKLDWEEAIDLTAKLNGEYGVREIPKAVQRLLGKQWPDFREKKYNFESFGAFAAMAGEAIEKNLGTPGESSASES